MIVFCDHICHALKILNMSKILFKNRSAVLAEKSPQVIQLSCEVSASTSSRGSMAEPEPIEEPPPVRAFDFINIATHAEKVRDEDSHQF